MGAALGLNDVLFVLITFLRSLVGTDVDLSMSGYSATIDLPLHHVAQPLVPAETDGYVRMATLSAATPDGPTVHHRIASRPGLAALEFDLTVTNGEMVGVRTPHVFDRWLHVTVPPHIALVPRYDWITVESLAPGAYRVDLGSWVYQGVLLHVPLLLAPHELVDDDGTTGPLLTSQLASMPWLGDGPGFADGLERGPVERSDATTITFRPDGLPVGEADYLDGNYGGAGGGASIRFDFGAEWEWLTDAQRFELMQRWSWVLHRRPQRCYLTHAGAPLDPADAPAGFKFTIGPLEQMIPDHQTNDFGFDEQWVAQNAHLLKGTVDLQHAPRWFGPDAYLAQRFGDSGAIERVAFMAAMARLYQPDPLAVATGELARGYGWNAALQATAVHVTDEPLVRDRALAWLERFADTCERDASPFGGLIMWTTNKEATTLAPLYVSQITGQPVSSIPIVPVTQPYQESILAWGLFCADVVGVDVDQQVLDGVLSFVCDTARAPGQPYPWYRTGVDGAQLAHHTDGYYHGTMLALAHLRGLAGSRDWIADYYAGLPFSFGAPAGPNFERWRNRWHLNALQP